MHAWNYLPAVLLSAAVGVANDQQVFRQHAAPHIKLTRGAYDTVKNSTGNLIFWSVNSLLQHWPNTRYINGTGSFQWILLDG